MKWFIYISLLALIVSCAPHSEKEKAEKPPEPVVSRDEAVSTLPCFRCHSYQRFFSMEKKAGVFPHGVHRNANYHCNQCHPFRGHHPMQVNMSICKDCHNLKTFTFASSGFAVRFNHESHAKLGCKECHLGLFLMKKGAATITMDDIYKGRYCGDCHNGKRAFPSSECAKCHEMKQFEKDVVFQGGGVGKVVFSHSFHLAMYKCADCHTKLFPMKKGKTKMTMDEMNGGKFCGACHNGTAATSVSECGKCHKG
jgi:c(7)-type cytochrome triheme protein